MTFRCTACLLLASAAVLGAQDQSVFLPLRTLPIQYFEPTDDTLSIDLTDLYAVFPAGGPVVTVRATIPVRDGEPRSIFTAVTRDASGNITGILNENPAENYQAYKTIDGTTMEHIYRPRRDSDPAGTPAFVLWSASDFQTETIEFTIETTGNEVPRSTGLFVSNVLDGNYNGTVLQQQSELVEGNRNLVFGQFRLYTDRVYPDAILEPIQSAFLNAEDTKREPVAGAVFLNRDFIISPFGPISQAFRVALTDNTSRFGSGFAGGYPVVGTISEEDLAKVAAFDEVQAFDMGNFLGGGEFVALPMYSTDYLKAENYATLSEVFLDPTNPRNVPSATGIEFTTEAISGTEFFEARYEPLPATVEGSVITLKRKPLEGETEINRDLGSFSFSVTARYPALDREFSQTVIVTSGNREIMTFFPAAFLTEDNLYNPGWFGGFTDQTWPYAGMAISTFMREDRTMIEVLEGYIAHGELGRMHAHFERRLGSSTTNNVLLYYPELGAAIAVREELAADAGNAWFMSTPLTFPRLYHPASGNWYAYVAIKGTEEEPYTERVFFDYAREGAQDSYFTIGPIPTGAE